MLDIYLLEEYNIVKYMRQQIRKESRWIVWRISQGTGHSQLELVRISVSLRQTINKDWERQVQSNSELCPISPAAPNWLATVSFGRKIFKKGANLWKKETFTEKLSKRTYGISGPLWRIQTVWGRSYWEPSLYHPFYSMIFRKSYSTSSGL